MNPYITIVTCAAIYFAHFREIMDEISEKVPTERCPLQRGGELEVSDMVSTDCQKNLHGHGQLSIFGQLDSLTCETRGIAANPFKLS